MVRSDAAGRDDDGARAQLDLAHDLTVRRLTSTCAVGREHVRAHAGDATVRRDEPCHAVARAQLEQPRAVRVDGRLHERLEDARPRAPRDVEARHGVAVAAREVTAALGPLHEREPAHAHAVQPRAHLARGEVDEAARPRVAVPVGPFAALRAGGELRGAEPVVERELG